MRLQPGQGVEIPRGSLPNPESARADKGVLGLAPPSESVRLRSDLAHNRDSAVNQRANVSLSVTFGSPDVTLNETSESL